MYKTQQRIDEGRETMRHNPARDITAAEIHEIKEAAGPEGAVGKRLDEYERSNLPGAIRAAWRAYNDPETPAEIRGQLRVALDYMIDKL